MRAPVVIPEFGGMPVWLRLKSRLLSRWRLTRLRSTASRSSAILGHQNPLIGIQYRRRLEHLGCVGRIDSRPEKTLSPNRATAERRAHPSFAANGNNIHRPRSPQLTHHYCNGTSGDQHKKDSYCAEKSGLEALIANNRLIYQERSRQSKHACHHPVPKHPIPSNPTQAEPNRTP